MRRSISSIDALRSEAGTSGSSEGGGDDSRDSAVSHW